ncbi:MAG: hypothetical protein IJ828_06675 [Treponema sp.]|nr:hypothetical protein [Treponema sp.]
MKKIFTLFLILLTACFSFAEDLSSKTLYRSGVYGQTFKLVEYTDGNKCRLLLYMADNKNTNKSSVTSYDSTLPTAYFIWSKWFTNPNEYSKAIEASKSFFDNK